MRRTLRLLVGVIMFIACAVLIAQVAQATDGDEPCPPWDICSFVSSGDRHEATDWTSQLFWVGPASQEVELELSVGPGELDHIFWPDSKLTLLNASSQPIAGGEIVMCIDSVACKTISQRLFVNSGFYRIRLQAFPLPGRSADNSIQGTITYNQLKSPKTTQPWTSAVTIGPVSQEIALVLDTPGALHPMIWQHSKLRLVRAGGGTVAAEIVLCQDVNLGENLEDCAAQLLQCRVGYPIIGIIACKDLVVCINDKLRQNGQQCVTPVVARARVGSGSYVLELQPSHAAIQGDVQGTLLYNREVDPPDEVCSALPSGDQFTLVPDRNYFTGLEFPRDQDWRFISAPAASGKMLLAMHVAGAADGGADDAATKNFDLELYDDGCQKLAGSYNASSIEWVGRQLPMKGEERILVNAAPNAQYRMRVSGADLEDFVPLGSDSSYHMFVSFGSRINAAFQWSKITWSYDPAPQPNAPAGVLTAVVTITNRSRFEFHDLTFDMTRLSGGNVLLNRDNTGASGITSLSVPNHELCETGYPSYLCRLDADITKGYTSFSVPFRIGLQQRQPFSFAADLYGNIVPGVTVSSSDAADLAALDGEGFQIEVTEEQLAPPEQTGTVYLPMVGK